MKTELMLFCTPVLWGLGFPIEKIILSEITTGWLNFFRSVLAALFLLPFVLRHRKNWNSRTLKNGILLGVFLFINLTTQAVGLQYTSAGENAFLCSTYVIMTPFVAWALKKIRPSGRNALSAVIAFAGIAVLSLNGRLMFGKGELITLCCPVAISLSLVITDLYAGEDDTYLLTGVQFLTVMVLTGVTAPLLGPFPGSISMSGFFSLLYMGIFYTGVAFVFQNYALAHASAEHTSVVLSLESVMGWLFGVLILHEPVTLRSILGGALVFAAILISVKGGGKVSSGEKETSGQAFS